MNILMSQKVGLDQYGTPIDLLECNYINYFSALGFNIFPVSNFFSDLSYFFQIKIDGVILTGSNDVEESNGYIHYRNDQEKRLMQFAADQNIPLLGICRGLQFIHYNFGGKLKQVDNHVACLHTLQFGGDFPGLKVSPGAVVNSYHNFAIDEATIDSNFKILARTEDGIVESIAHIKKPILAIQWHPERNDKLKQNQKFNKELIKSFFVTKYLKKT